MTTVNTSMFDMDFADGSFDLIWSEGAIYIQGFAAGLTAWRRFLKPGGWIAVSELTWLVPNPPPEAAEYWARNYPGMGSIERNCQIVAEAGYVSMDGFVLPSRTGGTTTTSRPSAASRSCGKSTPTIPTCSQPSTRPAASTISSAPITTATATSST